MAGWLHGVCVGACLIVSPLCGFCLSLFCNYQPNHIKTSTHIYIQLGQKRRRLVIHLHLCLHRHGSDASVPCSWSAKHTYVYVYATAALNTWLYWGTSPDSNYCTSLLNVTPQCSYKRVKGRSHTVEKRKASHPQNAPLFCILETAREYSSANVCACWIRIRTAAGG